MASVFPAGCSTLLHNRPTAHQPAFTCLPPVQPARPRPRSRDTWVRATAPPALRSAGSRTRQEGAPALDSSHWPSRLPVPGSLGRGLPVWAERRAEGGAVWRRKQARPGGGSPRRTMDSQGRKVVVCDNGTGVRPGGAASCVCGVRAGPSAAGLGCGGAGSRALGLLGDAGAPAGPEPARS